MLATGWHALNLRKACPSSVCRWQLIWIKSTSDQQGRVDRQAFHMGWKSLQATICTACACRALGPPAQIAQVLFSTSFACTSARTSQGRSLRSIGSSSGNKSLPKIPCNNDASDKEAQSSEKRLRAYLTVRESSIIDE